MNLEFDLSISHGQVVIHAPELKNAFNKWEREHIKQGFAWRPGSVSFGVYDSNNYRVEVRTADQIIVDSKATIAIVVPFTIPPSGEVVVAAVGEDKKIDMPSGKYTLLFEHWYVDASLEYAWIRLTFVPSGFIEPNILRVDEYLSPTYPLLMDAQPA